MTTRAVNKKSFFPTISDSGSLFGDDDRQSNASQESPNIQRGKSSSFKVASGGSGKDRDGAAVASPMKKSLTFKAIKEEDDEQLRTPRD